MKKIIVAVLLSLSLTVPAHAFIGAVIASIASAGTVVAITAAAGTIFTLDGIIEDKPTHLVWGILFDDEQEDFELTPLDVYGDIEERVNMGIYTSTQGELLKGEFAVFEAEEKSFVVKIKDIVDMDADQVIAFIQEKADVSTDLAEYFASHVVL